MEGCYGRAGGRDGRWRQAGRGCGPHDPILSIMPHALAHRAWLQPWAVRRKRPPSFKMSLSGAFEAFLIATGNWTHAADYTYKRGHDDGWRKVPMHKGKRGRS